jgi:hypothetical protein
MVVLDTLEVRVASYLASFFVQTVWGIVRFCFNSLFAMQPFEPSDGCLALRKLMANGSNG